MNGMGGFGFMGNQNPSQGMQRNPMQNPGNGMLNNQQPGFNQMNPGLGQVNYQMGMPQGVNYQGITNQQSRFMPPPRTGGSGNTINQMFPGLAQGGTQGILQQPGMLQKLMSMMGGNTGFTGLGMPNGVQGGNLPGR